MARASNILLGILNGIILMIGLMDITMGLHFLIGSNNQCDKSVHNSFMIIGAVLFFLSLLGLIASCYGINFILIVYLIIMFLLILGFIIFTIFAIFITNESVGKAASHLNINSRSFIRNHFVHEKNWNHIKNCLIDAKVCKSLGAHVDKGVSDFYNKTLSPVQGGCCKPPTECGYTYKNATFWIRPKTAAAVRNSDCKAWSNQQQTLCFNCESCKDGVVQTLRHNWKFLAIFNACITVVLIIFYTIGSCARKHISNPTNYYPKYAEYRGYRSGP